MGRVKRDRQDGRTEKRNHRTGYLNGLHQLDWTERAGSNGSTAAKRPRLLHRLHGTHLYYRVKWRAGSIVELQEAETGAGAGANDDTDDRHAINSPVCVCVRVPAASISGPVPSSSANAAFPHYCPCR